MSSSQQSQSKSYIRYTSSDGTIFRQRQGRLLSLLGFSSNGVVINENDMYTAVASFLALKHLEQRSGAVLSHLPELLEGCDFTWTIESRETQYSAMHAIRELVTATTPSLTTATTTTTTSSGSSSNGPASTSPFAILPISDTQSEDTASDTQSEDTNPTNTDTTTPEPATIPTSNAYWAIPEPEVQQNSTTSSSHNSYWTTAGPAATTTSQPTSSSNSIPLNLTIEPTTTPTPTTAPVDLLLQEDIPPRRTVPPSRPNLIGNNPPRTPRPIRTSVPVSTATTTTSGRGINQRMLLQDNDYWTTPAPASMETDASTTNSYWSTTSTATSTTTSTTTTSSSSSASEPAASPTTNHSEDANNGYWNINPEPSDANESSTTNENGNNSNTDNDYYWRTPEPQQAADEKPEEENANSYWTIPETTSDEAHVGENSYWALPEQQQSTESTTAATSTTSSPSHQHQQQQQEWQHPFAILGAVYSSVTIPLSILGGAYELPQISGSATSAALDTAPMFARTIPTNAGDARALMMYYRSIGVTHVACLYIKDPWGDYYNADLTREAFHRGIAYRSFAYTEDDIESSIARLANSGYKYIFAILFDWRPVIEAAYDYGIIGNAEYHWIGAEMVDWTGPTLQLSRHDPQDQKVAKALNGVGSLMLHVSEYAPLQKALQEFSEDEELQREFVESHPRADVRELLRFPQTQVNFYQHMFYDAVIALGLASCQTPGLFTGSELHKTMVNLQFEGVTGNVSFIAKTGGRSLESVSYRIDNVVLSDERSDDSFVRFQSNLAVMVSGENIQYQHPYIYADNSTMPPLALPPLEHNYNLMPIGVQVFGLLMAAGVILFSLAIIAWIVLKRNTFVVRASQPVFLAQLCLGTIIMASAVIPMSFQGKFPTSQLDTACMTIPWLTFLGFVLSFSALSSKTWRLNKLMNSGMGMRRIQIRAQDVLWPFFILLSINVTLLLGWTLKSPFKYHRVLLNNYDLYGREIESYGICKSDDTKFYYFLFPILLVNLIGLGIATYQSWIARNLPTEFSESYYLAISMASLFESLALGGPIVYMTFDNSTAFYLVGSALICICCLTILLPVFVPKYNHRKAAPTGRNRSSVLTGARSRISAPSGGLRVKNANESWGKMQIARSNSGISRNSGLSLGATGSGHGTEVLALPNASNYSGIGSLAEDSQIFDEKGK